MSWQEKISDHLAIKKGSSQLVLDKTGVLLHPRFLDYIEKKSFDYAVANSLTEILGLIKNPNHLVIAPFIQVPSYLAKKISIKVLDYNGLPIEIDYTVAQTLNTDQIIYLLAYRNQTREINLITAHNVEKELEKAYLSEKKQQVDDLNRSLQKTVQSVENYDDLLILGKTWGQYIYACHEIQVCPDTLLMNAVDRATEQLVLNGGIKNAFYATENHLKTVNKIRPYIEQKAMKSALICFDGMGAAEWILLKTYLASFGFKFSERYLFALIPTITKISRSSIFYGDCISVYSLKTPAEAAQFSKHFKNMTCKFFREGGISDESHVSGIDMVVVIYNFLDDIAHDTRLPPGDHTKYVYFKNVSTYLNRSGIKDELVLLKQLGYSVWICSDHGCVAGCGNGQHIDKYLIEESGKRATLVQKTELARFYDVNHYQIPFLDDDKVALLAKNRTMFAHKNYIGISHGGITLEELAVPFAEVIV
ncbi:MAG: PglZ domain-containing protein [Desulfobacteraceae bacterium]|nr:PglZ domain-containing protein [Desulfobacteraceae bacterium]